MLFYGASNVRWSDGCIEVTATRKVFGLQRGAQTHGFLIFYTDEGVREMKYLRVHERVHVWQACVLLGLPFMLLYGLDFLRNFVWVPNHYPTQPRWWRAYMGIYFEKMAYQIDEDYDMGRRPNAWGG